MEKLILEMCEIEPLSLNELSELLSRKPTSIRYQYINPLLKQGKHPGMPDRFRRKERRRKVRICRSPY